MKQAGTISNGKSCMGTAAREYLERPSLRPTDWTGWAQRSRRLSDCIQRECPTRRTASAAEDTAADSTGRTRIRLSFRQTGASQVTGADGRMS